MSVPKFSLTNVISFLLDKLSGLDEKLYSDLIKKTLSQFHSLKSTRKCFYIKRNLTFAVSNVFLEGFQVFSSD